MRKISFIFILFLLVISCEKNPDNLTVLLNQSANLSLKVIDLDQIGFKEAKVNIYSSVPASERIYYGLTDMNGICNIGKILQGQYEFYVIAEKDNKKYSLNEYFQVIAGEVKTIEVNPFLNIGGAKIKIVDINSKPIADVNVAIIPHPRFSDKEYIFQDLINEAYAINKTDSEGWVEFQDLPAGAKFSYEYSVMVYFDSENYYYPVYNNSISISRDTKDNFKIVIN
jgi:hypothetical protein